MTSFEEAQQVANLVNYLMMGPLNTLDDWAYDQQTLSEQYHIIVKGLENKDATV